MGARPLAGWPNGPAYSTSSSSRAAQLQDQARREAKRSAVELAAAVAHVATLAHDVSVLKGALPDGVLQQAARIATTSEVQGDCLTQLIQRLL